MFPASQATTAPLSLRDAHLINAALTLGYVFPLYLTKFTRLSFTENGGARSKGAPERWRDDPPVIKARLFSVSVSTIASMCLMHYIIAAGQGKPLKVRSKRRLGMDRSLFPFTTDWMGDNDPLSRVLFTQVRSPCPFGDTSSVPRSPIWSVPKSLSAFHDTLDVQST